MKSKSRKQMYSLVLLTLIALSMVACKQQATTKPTTGDYKTLTITTTSRTTHSSYSASLRGKQDVDIYPQITGLITKVCITEGATVKKGQVLFVIDQTSYKASVATALANVESAEASVATAQMTANSKAELYSDGIVSYFELNSARNTLRKEKATLAQARAELANARNDLSYTEVRSPVDGTAGMISYRIGALVGPSIATPLVTVSDNNDMYAYFSLTEKQMLQLTQQNGSANNAMKDMTRLGLVLNDGSTYSEKGKVDAISGIIDAKTGTVSVRAVFPNPKHVLRSGGTANVLMPYVKNDCIVVPQEATFELQDKTFVYKIVNGKTKSTPITVFPINNGKEYIVESGLKKGDVIIAEGAGLLHDGIEVKVK